jgi:hypothetical protein
VTAERPTEALALRRERVMHDSTSTANAMPTPEHFRDRFVHYLRYARGLELRQASPADHLSALELAIRESLIDRAVLTRLAYDQARPKTVHYLSVEYLLGRLVRNNLIATGMQAIAHEAMQDLGLRLDTILASATAASAGWQPASSTRWRPSTTRPLDTVCGTTTVCSGRASRRAGRLSDQTPGSAVATPGRSHAPISPSR